MNLLKATTSHDEAFNTARGIIAESSPLTNVVGTAIPTTSTSNGTLNLSLVGLKAGDVITNIIVFVTTTGTSLTFTKLGLFDSAGNFLKATAECSASFNSGANAAKVIPLTATYTVTSTGGYYLAHVGWGSGATGPTLYRGVSGTGTGTGLGSGLGTCATVSSQSDISGNVTLVAGTNNFWFACS